MTSPVGIRPVRIPGFDFAMHAEAGMKIDRAGRNRRLSLVKVRVYLAAPSSPAVRGEGGGWSRGRRYAAPEPPLLRCRGYLDHARQSGRRRSVRGETTPRPSVRGRGRLSGAKALAESLPIASGRSAVDGGRSPRGAGCVSRDLDGETGQRGKTERLVCQAAPESNRSRGPSISVRLPERAPMYLYRGSKSHVI